MVEKEYLMNMLLACRGDMNLIMEVLGAAGNTGDFTLNEIGDVLGITRERVRQIETKAMQKLKHPVFNKKFRRYLSYQVNEDMCNLVGD